VDPKLAEELADRWLDEALEVASSVDSLIAEETIVMRTTRPVLAIKENQAELVFKDQKDSEIWKSRLVTAKDIVSSTVRAVGRIELAGCAEFSWVGTGWLVAPNILVTNRHVAAVFATSRGAELVFKAGSDGAIKASVDFLQEVDNPSTQVFRLIRPLHIEGSAGPDLAFFAVEQERGPLASPIRLSARKPTETPNAATIGYPAQDSRIPDVDLMESIYGRIYDKKRLAPGAVTRVEDLRILHDCTTLGGNSGSVVIDLDTGEALGLHFSGSFLRTNYAVRSDVVKQRLEQLDKKAPQSRETTASSSPGTPQRRAPMPRVTGHAGPRRVNLTASGTSIEIPLVITVSLGDSLRQAPPRVRRVAAPTAAPGTAEDDSNIAIELPAADYKDRKGYVPDFLGSDSVVELPEVKRGLDDVLEFGDDETVLHYQHFSVVMSRSRRVCRFSAVNIDGGQSRKTPRSGWRWDPRIPREQQIMQECYGSPPRFSRGHMTRREDPAWGSPTTAKRGNEDSMHVTNTVPQMQSFNSPIWLGLEDYALQNAREDDMKVSVFTGPYLEDDDPEQYGVKIPVRFWKIIAFRHDATGELCATGYEMSQEENLEQPEFVYANYVSPQLNAATQVPISTIEFRSGLDFGQLASCDPLASEAADGAADPAPLLTWEQIRFR
jgi:endonuclease G